MKLDLTGVSVMLCMPVNRDPPLQTTISLMGTADLMRTRGIPFEFHVQYGSSIVEVARTKCADAFLKSDKSHLFWVDSDMSWDAESFLRILALATKMDVVGASYPYKSDPITFPLNPFGPFLVPNEYGCIQMKGFGLGFTAVTRRVMQALADKAPKLRFPDTPDPIPHIFRCDTTGDEFRGEDMAFFADVMDLGFEVFLDPTVTLGHVGQKSFEASLSDYLQRAQ